MMMWTGMDTHHVVVQKCNANFMFNYFGDLFLYAPDSTDSFCSSRTLMCHELPIK